MVYEVALSHLEGAEVFHLHGYVWSAFDAGSLRASLAKPLTQEIEAMSMLAVSEHDGVLVVDSRLVAERLGNDHGDWMQNVILPYQNQTEQAFGVLRFENGKPPKGSKGGRPSKYALLTEDQATFYMTLSKNTPEVVQCKIELVQAFSKAKELLRQRQPRPEYVPYWYERMKVALSDTEMPLQSGYFCVYREMMAFFWELETRVGYLVPDVNPITSEHLVPDISIGKRFNDF
ncbi:MAG: Rha family transcriptional regulator [Leptolyngbyaceae cyanobacterium CSU_1_3]|nr:Rha family transcriptional regulator [Leptolyngbyaceae cyanobacterium CSU_1_3]